MAQLEILPGSRVMAWDSTIYENDIKTPDVYRKGVVVCRYGCVSSYNKEWRYEDLVDVLFDHRPNRVSKGHFTKGVILLGIGER